MFLGKGGDCPDPPDYRLKRPHMLLTGIYLSKIPSQSRGIALLRNIHIFISCYQSRYPLFRSREFSADIPLFRNTGFFHVLPTAAYIFTMTPTGNLCAARSSTVTAFIPFRYVFQLVKLFPITPSSKECAYSCFTVYINGTQHRHSPAASVTAFK